MLFWDVINSPFILTLFSLIWASLVTSYITKRNQNDNKLNEMRVKAFHDVFSIYHKYIRQVKLADCDRNIILERHSELYAISKQLSILFSEDISKGWICICQNLININSLEGKKQKEKIDLLVKNVDKLQYEMMNIMVK